MVARMVMGTKILGVAPRVVPSKPRAATPMAVMAWPLIVMAALSTSGRAPKCDTQKAWLSTTSGCAPGVTSSAGVSSRPSAGTTPSVGK